VITVCDETAAGQCPVFPGITKRLHWLFKDLEELTGTHAEKTGGIAQNTGANPGESDGLVKTVL